MIAVYNILYRLNSTQAQSSNSEKELWENFHLFKCNKIISKRKIELACHVTEDTYNNKVLSYRRRLDTVMKH